MKKQGQSKNFVAVLDDQPVVRMGIEHVLRRDGRFILEWKYGTYRDLEAGLHSGISPDLLILDLTLPDVDGLDCIRALRQSGHTVPILVFSMHDEQIYASRAVQLGANGYLMKRDMCEKLPDFVDLVIDGHLAFSEAMQEQIIREHFRSPIQYHESESLISDVLTNRELQVFSRMGKGLRAQAIARELGISIKTIDTHRSNIKTKLQLESASQVTAYAAQWIEKHEGAGVRGA